MRMISLEKSFANGQYIGKLDDVQDFQ